MGSDQKRETNRHMLTDFAMDDGKKLMRPDRRYSEASNLEK